jgi:hypothetical protein
MKNNAALHTTTNEISFINGLSLASLKAYQAAIRLRKEWGGIDRRAIVLHCNERINALESSSKRS